MNSPRIIISCGEPAGVGPDVTLLALRELHLENLLVVGDPVMLRARAKALGLDMEIVRADLDSPLPAGCVNLFACDAKTPVRAGELDAQNAAYVIACINACADACLQKRAAAMVTAPVNKRIINDAGIAFSGHTEWLAARCRESGAKDTTPVMMLASETLRVCLATTHLPLAQVAAAITRERLQEVLRVMHRDLRRLYQINSPRIGVCALNPHAGEGGHLGDEEIKTIRPTLEELRGQGLDLLGPLPADTAFTPQALQNVDAVLAMFHDQGLPVVKHRAFGDAVNVTLGLPIIRTSVDHGSALELAASGKVDARGMLQAILLAREFARREGAA